ncbi:putative 28S rRNA (cytosine-C(5))-methyltransferase [Phlyctochytrium planicorne]|nr:putative 28S rRNA (cytosine-C(5))-methyltransferase [Phlyctochytrium planicorne]
MQNLTRTYKSDTSLLPNVGRTDSDRAAGHRPVLVMTQSEPALNQGRKPHPLLDDSGIGDPHTYNELLVAAETLENIVMEGIHGTTAGAIRRFKGFSHGSQNDENKPSSGREMSDRILRLVYGTMKYLPFIDTILVKTQFLVYNNQFLNYLGLVKIVFYDLMRYHFDIHKFPGVDYHTAVAPAPKSEIERAELVQDLEESIRRHGVKLAAAFARIRIERRATGDTIQEQMENILPEEVRAKELFADSVEMPKTVRINYLKTDKEGVAEELRDFGFRVKTVPPTLQQLQNRASNNVKTEFIELDETFSDYFVIPPDLFSEIKSSRPVLEGRLIFQDRASAYGIKHLESILEKDEQIIAARVGCGVNVCALATAMKNKGKIYAFENRPSRLESLRVRLHNQNVKNVEIIESDFITADIDNPDFAQAKTIILEPPSTGGAIVDKLGFLLQEEEFPNEHCSVKDQIALKRQQINMLKQAMSFPSAKTILYITRSTKREENEQVLEDILVSCGHSWELSCVLPDIVNERENDWEIEECLKIRPSESGNGIFVACLNKLPTQAEIQAAKDEEERAREREEAAQAALAAKSEATLTHNEGERSRGRKSRKRRPGSGSKVGLERKGSAGARRSTQSLPRLTKSLSESVNRLSIPRRRSPDGNDATKTKRKSINKLRRRDSKADESVNVDSSSDNESNESDDNDRKLKKKGEKDGGLMNEFGFDFGVFGMSLKRFYAPQKIAMQQISANPGEVNRWKYPVPNPKPWR